MSDVFTEAQLKLKENLEKAGILAKFVEETLVKDAKSPEKTQISRKEVQVRTFITYGRKISSVLTEVGIEDLTRIQGIIHSDDYPKVKNSQYVVIGEDIFSINCWAEDRGAYIFEAQRTEKREP